MEENKLKYMSKERLRLLIGKKIKQLRKEKGLSMLALSEFPMLSSVTPANLSRIENGKVNSTLDRIELVLRALEMEVQSVELQPVDTPIETNSKTDDSLKLYKAVKEYPVRVQELAEIHERNKKHLMKRIGEFEQGTEEYNFVLRLFSTNSE